MAPDDRNGLRQTLKRQRLTIPLTLRELSAKSGVSPSHLGRIERGERYPSAKVLNKIAGHLGFQETALMIHAGYIHHTSPDNRDTQESQPLFDGLDPYVANVLAKEPVEFQRAILAIMTAVKHMAVQYPQILIKYHKDSDERPFHYEKSKRKIVDKTLDIRQMANYNTEQSVRIRTNTVR